jgi:hypothetical protein
MGGALVVQGNGVLAMLTDTRAHEQLHMDLVHHS